MSRDLVDDADTVEVVVVARVDHDGVPWALVEERRLSLVRLPDWMDDAAAVGTEWQMRNRLPCGGPPRHT